MAQWWVDNSQPPGVSCASKVYSTVLTVSTPGTNQAGPYPTRAAAMSACRKGATAPPPPPPPPSPTPGRPPPRGKPKASISADALRYAGQGYVYGGVADRPGDWDCSSFVSYVLGHDLGMRLPPVTPGGGSGRYGDPGYPPNSHGPVVLDYNSWAGSVPVASPVAGDLCLWPGGGTAGHMGIAISPTRMISALNPQLGTMVTAIQGAGPSGVRVVFRRVTGAPGAVPALRGMFAPGAGPSRSPLVTAGVLVALFGAAALLVVGLGVAMAAGTMWAGRKAIS